MTRTQPGYRLALVLLIIALVIAFFASGLNDLLTLEALKARQQELERLVAEHRAISISAYFLAYVLITAVSIPGAAVMTLLGGALFGVLTGTVIFLSPVRSALRWHSWSGASCFATPSSVVSRR